MHVWNPEFLELPQTLSLCNLFNNAFSHNCSNPRADVIQVNRIQLRGVFSLGFRDEKSNYLTGEFFFLHKKKGWNPYWCPLWYSVACWEYQGKNNFLAEFDWLYFNASVLLNVLNLISKADSLSLSIHLYSGHITYCLFVSGMCSPFKSIEISYNQEFLGV